MNIYFFKNIPANNRAAFRKHYTLQNLKAVQVASAIFFALNVFLRLFYTLVPNSLTRAANFPEFNYSNWAYIILTPIFYLISKQLLTAFGKKNKPTGLMNAFVITFSVYLMFSGILASFIAMYNLQDNLTMYLVALITVSVMCVFEYEDTIMLTILTELLFTVILFWCETDPTEVIYNQVTSMVLLCGFYFITRYIYSYKASHFMHLNEIQRKNIEIEKASDFKNDVLGIVAHDLRNPIAAIESIAMIMELESPDEELQDNLGMIKTSCVKARSIVSDLLEVAKNENDRPFETQLIELNALVKNTIATWKSMSEVRNHIRLTEHEKNVFVHINPEKFNRVLDNLISNALKFSKERDDLDIILGHDHHMALLQIQDHGVGIPAAMLPHIFERFTKAGRSGLKGETSTGLGLSIVKQIIEKHGGKISVASEEGKGSTFSIWLPLAKGE
ncbi:sensor histidine kinase [Mucilaginibacter boryungensis]|uniref:histidine kinase n=1 Tax=Mucilaginibacter boryungensis TaxID=768480 RepID=A0ABR9XG77_9SPHI|nr:HAMP domain-containing sensor histidine kinase [Mucilaginibacter boryungensis]MBE9666200.1 HAMP domain-containing histidine kinase [Mucilaginibacter boryungensis]